MDGSILYECISRTAGFATYSLGTFSKSGLLVIIILMIIGASPGSTGGGIKTSTFFVLIQGVKSAATNKSEKAFHYAVPKEAFRKASVIMILAMCVVTVGSYLMEYLSRILILLIYYLRSQVHLERQGFQQELHNR